MSKVLIVGLIVVAAGGLLLATYDILMFNLGLPSIVAFLYSLWPDVRSGIGTAAESIGWIAALATAIVAMVLVYRWPRYRKY